MTDKTQKYDDTNRGVLFKNEEKLSENSPDYTGSLNVDGKLFRLAGWIKVGRESGKKFLSLLKSEIKEKEGGTPPATAPETDDDPGF
jgi:hypothetical protein